MRPLALLFVFVRAATLSCGCNAASAPAVDAPVVPVADSRPAPAAPALLPRAAMTSAPAPAPLPVAFHAHLAALAAGIDGEDGTLFRRGHEAERAEDPAAARRAYLELIKRHPDSPLVPYAYLAFADLFFREAENDAPDRWAFAQQAYQKVLTYPPPNNVAFAYALQRLAASFNRAKDFQQALAAAHKSLGAMASVKDLPLGRETAEAARRELVVAFAGAGQPNKAPLFFRSADPANAPALLLALGEEYAAGGMAREAIALYETALRASTSPALCAAAEQAVRKLEATADPQTKAMLRRFETQQQALCRAAP